MFYSLRAWSRQGTTQAVGLPIDFSVCCGGHPPSQITNRVAQELYKLPGIVRTMARLTVDTGNAPRATLVEKRNAY